MPASSTCYECNAETDGGFVWKKIGQGWSHVLLGFFAGLLEQESDGFVGAQAVGDAAERSIFLEPLANGGHRFPFLLGDALDFAIDLVPGGGHAFALSDFIDDHRSLHIAKSLGALGFFQL